MGRKIRSALIMGLAMILLYEQCGVLYAEETAVLKEPAGPDESEEPEKPEEPEEPEESEGSEEPDKQEEPEESEEPGEPEEPEGPEEPEEPENPEEPEEPMEQYQLEIPQADGENGYYRVAPCVTLMHVSSRGVTKYLVKNNGQTLAGGTLSGQRETVQFGQEELKEGENILTVWMEEENGDRIEAFASERKLIIDTCAPEIALRVSGGSDAWHQGSATIQAEATDAVSQVASVSCRVGQELIGTSSKSSASFSITRPSVGGKGVEVTVTATDRAGNQSSQTQQIYIDGEAPKVNIAGTEDYQVISHPVELTYTVEEDNALADIQAWTDWEDVQGHTERLSVSTWQSAGTGASSTQTLADDGIYQVHLQAQDAAGFTGEQSRQVIVDTKKPQIRHVKELEGKYLQRFKWQYSGHELVRDFTSCTYTVRLDGQLYQMGKEITIEGRHSLEVTAIDAVGNEAVETASFVIDHTAPEILFMDVQDGESYEKELTFQVRLADDRDTIRQIRINGQSQHLEAEQDEYRFMVQEVGDCTVSVKAFDLAGNMAERELTFTILPEREDTFFGRITEPIQGMFTGGTDDPDTLADLPAGKSSINVTVLVTAGILLLICAAGLGGTAWYRKRLGRPEEEDEEEEAE